MHSETDGLAARQVSYAYGRAPVLEQVTLALARGEMLALAGPNGSGKTTLLKVLAGFVRPAAGTVTLSGRDLVAMSARERARHIAVVPQRTSSTLTFRVESMVAMGRTPHLGALGPTTAADRQAIDDALTATEMAGLADRRFNQLSGGEQQRVLLGMALAQEAEYLLLDEPTVHLDLHHQHAMLELLRTLHAGRRLGVLAVMHDLNLAALYFDRIAVLDDGRVSAEGKPAKVLCREDVMRVFRAPLAVVAHPTVPVPQVLLEPGHGPG